MGVYLLWSAVLMRAGMAPSLDTATRDKTISGELEVKTATTSPLETP